MRWSHEGNCGLRNILGIGRRGVDEMSHMWVGMTELEQEEFDRLVAERRAKVLSQEGQGGTEEENQ